MSDVQLDHLIAGTLAGVLQHETDFDGSSARRSGKNRRSDLQVSISERRVAQAISEWLQRYVTKVHVRPAVPDIVIHHRRQLLKRSGPRLDQTTGRVVGAKQH